MIMVELKGLEINSGYRITHEEAAAIGGLILPDREDDVQEGGGGLQDPAGNHQQDAAGEMNPDVERDEYYSSRCCCISWPMSNVLRAWLAWLLEIGASNLRRGE